MSSETTSFPIEPYETLRFRETTWRTARNAEVDNRAIKIAKAGKAMKVPKEKFCKRDLDPTIYLHTSL